MAELTVAEPFEEINYFDTHDFRPEDQNAVVFYGVGANTRHLAEAGALAVLMSEKPVFFLQHGEPQIEIPDDQLIRTDTAEGRARAERLMNSGGVHAAYVSTPPESHRGIITGDLKLAGKGLLNRIVAAKPVVTSEQEVEEVDIALWEAEWERTVRGIPMPRFGDEEKSFLYIHEHYQRKEAWYEFRKQLSEVIDILGRPTSVFVDIEEPITVEQEHRERAFAGGALEDFGPHTTSLFLDVAYSINNTDRYAASSLIASHVNRFRYDPTALQEDVDTGFIVHGTTRLFDRVDSEQHDLPFTLMGGKGLANRKEATITFVHPDTGDESTVRVDLKNNKLHLPDDAPQALKDLFPKTEFSDNGYGRIVLAGLNGGDPDISFQHWYQAKIVTKWIAELTRQGHQNELIKHSIGTSLSEMDGVSVRTAGRRSYLVASAGSQAVRRTLR